MEYLSSKEERRKKDFVWVERASFLLDNRFSIGGFRFGLDPLLNFIPFAGQVVAFGVSILLVIIMFRNGVSSKAAVKMLLNVMYDACFGSIPLVGHVFDFFNKANQKNIKILHEHYFEHKHQGSAAGILIFIVCILCFFCVAIVYVMWSLAEWSYKLLEQIFIML